MGRLTFRGDSDDEKVNVGPDGGVLSLSAGILVMLKIVVEEILSVCHHFCEESLGL